MATRRAVIKIEGTSQPDAEITTAQVTDEVIAEMEENIRARSWQLDTSVSPGAADRSSRRYGDIQVGIEYDPDDALQVDMASKAEQDLRNIAQKKIAQISTGGAGFRSV